MQIEPSEDQREQLETVADEGPVVMVNLLGFRERADGPEPRSGVEAYASYGARLAPLLERVGGELLLVLDVQQTVIGLGQRPWDMVAVVRYPSRAAFLAMVSDPEYSGAGGIHEDRAAGLARTELLACKELVNALR